MSGKDSKALNSLWEKLDNTARERITAAVDAVCAAKEAGKKVVVVVGSGPNIHEGVSTLIAALMTAGIVDGVTTSSAVVAHEMAGALDRVHRVNADLVGVPEEKRSLDNKVEVSLISDLLLEELKQEMVIDEHYYRRLLRLPGEDIIKAAGNMAYPMGLRTERLAREAETIARACGATVEEIVGGGADPLTMIGAGARAGLPVIVTVPQLVGGGAVGLAIGDCIPITERSWRVACLLAGAEVIIESGVVLTQEIHDGPFEMYTGHGVWANWEGLPTYSLAGKTIIRIDLDPNLEAAWQQERQSSVVAEAIAKGLPKTKLTGVPFRMEMSGFCRLPGSLPIVADLGVVWPLLASQVCDRLKVDLPFMSYPQETPQGQEMREWIVENVRPVNRVEMLKAARARAGGSC